MRSSSNTPVSRHPSPVAGSRHPSPDTRHPSPVTAANTPVQRGHSSLASPRRVFECRSWRLVASLLFETISKEHHAIHIISYAGIVFVDILIYITIFFFTFYISYTGYCSNTRCVFKSNLMKNVYLIVPCAK